MFLKEKNIFIDKVNRYDLKLLEKKVDEILNLFYPALDFESENVYIKPNCLMPSEEEKAEITNSLLIKAVCKAVKKRNGNPIVCDSPAFGSLDVVMKKIGFWDWARENNVKIVELKKCVKTETINNLTGKPLKISCDLINGKYVINLPKLKAHTQLKMTCAVKNMYGAVCGKRKVLYHMYSKNNLYDFAELLLRVCYTINPMITIVDGIISLSDYGPRNGRPIKSNVLFAGLDPVSVDCLAAKILGAEIDAIPVNLVAKNNKVGKYIELDDDVLKEYMVYDFKFPAELSPVMFNPLRVMRSFIKHYIRKILKK